MEPSDDYFDEASDAGDEAMVTEKPLQLFDLLKPDSKEAAVWSTLNLHPFGLASWASDSVEAMRLQLVQSPDDLDDEESEFHPEMTYQVFGQKELIAGYRDLKVRLAYSAGSLRTLLNITYSEKADPNNFEAEDIEGKLKERLQPGYFTSVDNFTIGFEEEESKFKPPGELLHKFLLDTEDGQRSFEVYRASVEEQPAVADYCARLQPFLLWFIEAASFVDLDDPRWRFFLLFKRLETGRFAFAGFASVYEFFHYPQGVRPRLSQMLVLPPFQSAGLGARLLDAVFNSYRSRSDVADISVESPSIEFQRLRDFVDAQAAKELPEFADIENGKVTKEMHTAARNKLKISKRQAERVCNILRLQALDTEDEAAVERFVEELRVQSDRPNQRMRERAEKRRLREAVEWDRLVEAIPSFGPEHRVASTKAAQDLFQHYSKVVERLDSSAN